MERCRGGVPRKLLSEQLPRRAPHNQPEIGRAGRSEAVWNLGRPKPCEAFEGFDSLFKNWEYSK